MLLLHYIRTGTLPLGDKDEGKYDNRRVFFSLPPMQTARANVIADLTSLNKLPSTKVFVAAENGSVEVLGLVALFLLETGTFGAKNW